LSGSLTSSRAQPINLISLVSGQVYTLAKDVAPGKFVPTPTHAFIRLLHEKGRLHTCYTQNIDTLERQVGVPSDKIIEAHGSFASQRCISCKTHYDDEKMKAAIAEARVPRCGVKKCNGLVKPDIVFFGESVSTTTLIFSEIT
jgi:NAD-dependent histone deacetylase SIR2